MAEINWKEVADKYKLTPDQLKNQVFIASSVMADMMINEMGDEFEFNCIQPLYDIQLTVKRI